MAPVTLCDSGALGHILSIILAEPPPSNLDIILPFQSCLSTAGVSNAFNFVSIPSTSYGSILFSLNESGIQDQKLNVIQVGKINSLLSWYHQVPSPLPS